MSSASARSTSLRGIARGTNSSRIRYRIHRRGWVTHHVRVGQAIRNGTEHDIISAASMSDCRELLKRVDLRIYGQAH